MGLINQQVQDGPSEIAVALARDLSRAGIRHALSPIGIAESLWEEVSAVHEQGLLAPEIFAAYQEYWRFVPPAG